MILVDASVWIDFLTAPHSKHQAHLSDLIHVGGGIGIPGPVIQEVLQGIRDAYAFRRIEEHLKRFPVVHAGTATYVIAARLYQTLTAKGSTMPPGDVTIAAIAIETEHELYTLDHHFHRIAAQSALRLYRPTPPRP